LTFIKTSFIIYGKVEFCHQKGLVDYGSFTGLHAD